MARPRTYKTEAVVLKQSPLGEADRILTLITPDVGKVRAVAKGIRRIKSRQGGNLELLNQVDVSLAEGRNLDVVSESVLVRSFRSVKEDLALVSRAMYLAELIDAFSYEKSSSYSIYHLLLYGLDWLGKAANTELLTRWFEVRLLDASGYRPEVMRCVECRSELQPGDHLFSASEGGALCPNCPPGHDQPVSRISLDAMKVLRLLLREPRYDRIDTTTVAPPQTAELERLLRAYMRFLLEKEFKTAEFMHLASSNGG
jgi:DNA repair protein RecO (recombination protein O)